MGLILYSMLKVIRKVLVVDDAQDQCWSILEACNSHWYYHVVSVTTQKLSS